MNVRYTLHDVDFEWDDQKASSNSRKHGIAFETACEVFFDPFIRVVDDELVEGEQREAVIGMTSHWQLLHVVYTWRGDTIRLISARPVTGPEKKAYENQ